MSDLSQKRIQIPEPKIWNLLNIWKLTKEMQSDLWKLEKTDTYYAHDKILVSMGARLANLLNSPPNDDLCEWFNPYLSRIQRLEQMKGKTEEILRNLDEFTHVNGQEEIESWKTSFGAFLSDVKDEINQS
jgi:hypothetical protein